MNLQRLVLLEELSMKRSFEIRLEAENSSLIKKLLEYFSYLLNSTYVKSMSRQTLRKLINKTSINEPMNRTYFYEFLQITSRHWNHLCRQKNAVIITYQSKLYTCEINARVDIKQSHKWKWHSWILIWNFNE